jgi:hypothetical protein
LERFFHPRQAAGSKTSGTWEEVFGKGPKADEIFIGWNYAQYIDYVARAGKKELLAPMYVNVWLVQVGDKGPGDYPSGEPVEPVHDMYHAGAPNIDAAWKGALSHDLQVESSSPVVFFDDIRKEIELSTEPDMEAEKLEAGEEP